MSKLSHSQANKYLQCGYAHHLHYKKKLRPKITSAALLLGSALDEAINVLLERKLENPPEEKGLPIAKFMERWERGWINRTLIDLPMSTRIAYAAKDYDSELMKPSDWFKIDQAKESLNIESDLSGEGLISDLMEQKKQSDYRYFAEEKTKLINYAFWLCCARKAEIILDSYEKDILPRIKRVIVIQKKVVLENDEGDSVEGYVDLIAEWEDGKVYVIDNKSSSRMYELDSVKNSAQLSLYTFIEDIEYAGFIVYLKQIKKNKHKVCTFCGYENEGTSHKTCNSGEGKKRCGGEWDITMNPEATIQVILDKVDPVLQGMVIENFNKMNEFIDKGIYLRNLNSCTNHFGGLCPYYSHCYRKDDSDLEIVD